MINGNVLAGGDILIGGSVNGSVTHGGALTFGTFADAGDMSGGSTACVPVTPALFVAPALPAGTAAVAGFNDITLETFAGVEGQLLAGGNLIFEGSNAVNTIIPEPASAALLALGGLLLTRRRAR